MKKRLKERPSGEFERIRKLFEESDEQVARFFRQFEPEPHVASRHLPKGPAKDAPQESST